MQRTPASRGSVALAVIMLPLMARSSQEVILLVPTTLREASDALGVARWRTMLTVILPTALGGIVTGTILAVARAAGETAPLLVLDSVCIRTSRQPVLADPQHPVLILTASEQPDPSGIPQAWGAALVLLTLILMANLGARFLLARSRRRSPDDEGDPDVPSACPRRASCRAERDPDVGGAGSPLPARRRRSTARAGSRPARAVFDIRDMSVSYGAKKALDRTTMKIHRNLVTAVIGPSGCGKSTFIRCLNRMNDSIPGFRIERAAALPRPRPLCPRRQPRRGAAPDRHGLPEAQPVREVDLRQCRLGAPQPGDEDPDLDDRVERALRGAALWDEVKDRLQASALGLSGGQQQRLCIARAIAVEPDVLLLDEPASALDPVATARSRSSCMMLKRRYTIVIVTHNMQQAARVADRTAFFSLDPDRSRDARRVQRHRRIFTNPRIRARGIT